MAGEIVLTAGRIIAAECHASLSSSLHRWRKQTNILRANKNGGDCSLLLSAVAVKEAAQRINKRVAQTVGRGEESCLSGSTLRGCLVAWLLSAGLAAGGVLAWLHRHLRCATVYSPITAFQMIRRAFWLWRGACCSNFVAACTCCDVGQMCCERFMPECCSDGDCGGTIAVAALAC